MAKRPMGPDGAMYQRFGFTLNWRALEIPAAPMMQEIRFPCGQLLLLVPNPRALC